MPVNRFDSSASGAPPEAEPDDRDDAAQHGGPEALRRLQAQLEELGEYARLYLAARSDAIFASIRSIVLWSVVGIVALLAVVALLATAATIGLLGIAELVGGLLDSPWAGNVITGFGFLAVCLVGLVAVVLFLQRRFRKRMMEKYAKRHAQQRRRFGRDVVGQAAARQAERS